jgi:hypothetical protein
VTGLTHGEMSHGARPEQKGRRDRERKVGRLAGNWTKKSKMI